jgi:hypothetical protein
VAKLADGGKNNIIARAVVSTSKAAKTVKLSILFWGIPHARECDEKPVGQQCVLHIFLLTLSRFVYFTPTKTLLRNLHFEKARIFDEFRSRSIHGELLLLFLR